MLNAIALFSIIYAIALTLQVLLGLCRKTSCVEKNIEEEKTITLTVPWSGTKMHQMANKVLFFITAVPAGILAFCQIFFLAIEFTVWNTIILSNATALFMLAIKFSYGPTDIQISKNGVFWHVLFPWEQIATCNYYNTNYGKIRLVFYLKKTTGLHNFSLEIQKLPSDINETLRTLFVNKGVFSKKGHNLRLTGDTTDTTSCL